MAAYDKGNIIRALRGNSTRLSLDNTKITCFHPALSRLTSLTKLSAKNNQLDDDNGTNSQILQPLKKLTTLNLGGNNFSTLPICLSHLPCLSTLHFFKNQITELDDAILESLQQIVILNLNENLIDEIPSTISMLKKLLILNVANNKLTHIPRELCKLSSLTELHLQGNLIEQLPYEIGCLKKLKKLYLQKNKLKSLTSSIGHCRSLQLLDISGNQIQLFPNEIGELKLMEFYYELNPLIPFIPVPSSLFVEVLSLQEIISRKLIKLITNDAELGAMVQKVSQVKDALSHVGTCAVCNGPFINTWLDCVKFVPTKKLFPSVHIPSSVVPIRAVLCSYECFNSAAGSHEYYGIATPSVK